jgi:hypothetical protein
MKEKTITNKPSSLRPFEDMWVALSRKNGNVLESDKSLDRLLAKIGKKDLRLIEFFKVPKFDTCYAPGSNLG